MGPEAKLEQKLRGAVIAAGGLCIKLEGTVGMPDRLVILPGPTYTFVEMKAESGRLSEIQKAKIATLQQMGCDVRVVQGREETEAFCEKLWAKPSEDGVARFKRGDSI